MEDLASFIEPKFSGLLAMAFVVDKLATIGLISQIFVAYLLLDECSGKAISAFYIFGDSLVDAGNNFYLSTGVKANFPNGIDFGNPFGIPSGRFTNGRSVTDILGQEVGLKDFTPAYFALPTGEMVLNGVNYASGASGILNDTEWFTGYQINLDAQISNYAKTRQEIISRIGAQEAQRLFRQALYVVVVGSNDVIFGRFLKSISVDTYLDTAISRFRSQITRLYNLEARNFLITNSPAVGCIPFVRDLHSSQNGCIEFVNQQAQLYNEKLNSLLAELTLNLEGSKLLCANTYAMLDNILHDYKSYGFENEDSACCHVAGRHGGLVPCGSLSQVCPDRSKYVFWDPFHLTETSYTIIAKNMMDGGLDYISPMNLRQLLNLKT